MFPEIIKALRTERNLLQKEVAAYLGITRPAYSAYEMGKRQPDYATLINLASFFNVSTDYLLGYSTSTLSETTFVTHKQRKIVAHIDDSVTDKQLKEILRYIDLLKLENSLNEKK